MSSRKIALRHKLKSTRSLPMPALSASETSEQDRNSYDGTHDESDLINRDCYKLLSWQSAHCFQDLRLPVAPAAFFRWSTSILSNSSRLDINSILPINMKIGFRVASNAFAGSSVRFDGSGVLMCARILFEGRSPHVYPGTDVFMFRSMGCCVEIRRYHLTCGFLAALLAMTKGVNIASTIRT